MATKKAQKQPVFYGSSVPADMQRISACIREVENKIATIMLRKWLDTIPLALPAPKH